MIYTAANLKVCFAAPLEIYTQWRDEMGAAGFHTLSLSLAGPASEPIYTAVMVKPAQPFARRAWARRSLAELNATCEEMKASNPTMVPYILSATGSGEDPVYAVCFREMPGGYEALPRLSAKAFEQANDRARKKGRRLLWVDAFGRQGDIRYCAVWVDNPDNAAWNAQAVNDKGSLAEARHEVLRSIGARPVHVALTPEGGRAKIYVDSQLAHGWFAAGLMPARRFQEVCDEQAQQGRQPVNIGTTVLEDGLNYTALFAHSDELVPRSFRTRGPTPAWRNDGDVASGAAIDRWVQQHLKDNGRRGAALAVVQGTRLVFARGYTLAEPSERDVTPTTLFRLASVSKALCGAAVWKALADSTTHSRGSTLQSVLNLKTRMGTQPQGNFGRITLRHLLEGCSGIDQGSMRDAMARIKDSDVPGTQPASVATLASEVAATPMAFETLPAPTRYGKVDYWLLGQVAARLCGERSFDAALKKLVLDPLQMKLTRSSGSRLDPQATDVPLYHRQDIGTARSAIDDNRRLVPAAYGDENYAVFDGAGGVSSAVVDVARLCAMYSCRSGNPVFTPEQLDAMFVDAMSAAARALAADPEAHGCFHGFGQAYVESPGIFLAKGGDLPGVETDFFGVTGELFIVFLRNGDHHPTASLPGVKAGLEPIVKQINWRLYPDLFPSFGMKAL